jgi:3-deoxy-manno-octulosonate cytidylyltransferase (CMP-KDO synthetase)
VYRRALDAALGPVAVACGDAAIADAIRGEGGVAIMTDPDLPSGSDRVFAALSLLDPGCSHDVVVNLQGDLPSLPPAFLHAVLTPLADPEFDLATLVAEIHTERERAAPSVVKAVCAFPPGKDVAQAWYFSRAAVPAGNRPALRRFVTLPPSLLEQQEKLEQLRALEAGMRIGVARVDHAPHGVDTEQDLERARRDLAP